MRSHTSTIDRAGAGRGSDVAGPAVARALHRHRARLAATALVVIALALAGCAGPASTAPAPPDLPASASPPAPTASPTAPGGAVPAQPGGDDAAPDAPLAIDDALAVGLDSVVERATQNGTMRMAVWADWRLEDASGMSHGSGDGEHWANAWLLSAPSGLGIAYYDGHGGDAGSVIDEWRVLERIDTSPPLAAMTWWSRTGDRWQAHAALVERDADGRPADRVAIVGSDRQHSARGVLADGEDLPWFASAEEAEAYLASADVRQVLDVLAHIELLPAPSDTTP